MILTPPPRTSHTSRAPIDFSTDLPPRWPLLAPCRPALSISHLRPRGRFREPFSDLDSVLYADRSSFALRHAPRRCQRSSSRLGVFPRAHECHHRLRRFGALLLFD